MPSQTPVSQATHESVMDYATRAAINTANWLEDRSANCHPLFYCSPDFSELVSDLYPPTMHSMGRGKLRNAEKAALIERLKGYAYAKRSAEISAL